MMRPWRSVEHKSRRGRLTVLRVSGALDVERTIHFIFLRFGFVWVLGHPNLPHLVTLPVP